MSLRDSDGRAAGGAAVRRRGRRPRPRAAAALARSGPAEPIFNVVLKYFKPRSMAMAVIHGSQDPVGGHRPGSAQARDPDRPGRLLPSKDLEPAIDLNALVGARFDQAQRPERPPRPGARRGASEARRMGTARPGRALPGPGPGVADELIEAVADAFRKERAPPSGRSLQPQARAAGSGHASLPGDRLFAAGVVLAAELLASQSASQGPRRGVAVGAAVDLPRSRSSRAASCRFLDQRLALPRSTASGKRLQLGRAFGLRRCWTPDQDPAADSGPAAGRTIANRPEPVCGPSLGTARRSAGRPPPGGGCPSASSIVRSGATTAPRGATWLSQATCSRAATSAGPRRTAARRPPPAPSAPRHEDRPRPRTGATRTRRRRPAAAPPRSSSPRAARRRADPGRRRAPVVPARRGARRRARRSGRRG